MEKTYKGFKGEKIVDEGKELIVLAGEDPEDVVWIENDEIRATNLEALQKILIEYEKKLFYLDHFHLLKQ